MAKPPTFQEIQKATKNGKCRVGKFVQGRHFTCQASTFRGRSIIDFDLHPGNHDLRREVQDALWERYVDYCSAFGYRSKIHTHFSKTSIMCEVNAVHSEEWFSLLWRVVSDVENLSRIRCEFMEEYARRELGQVTAGGILFPSGKVNEGELVRAIAPAFKQIIELLQFDHTVLHSMSPRQFEQLLAAAYERLGFDKVVLTPRSGDHGRDLIVEKHGWGAMRFFVEAKKYQAANLVEASEVRSLLGTLVAEPPTTRAILVTTSDFAPGIRNAPNIAPLLGSRLELLNGTQLIERLVQIEHSPEKPILGFGGFTPLPDRSGLTIHAPVSFSDVEQPDAFGSQRVDG
jgi:restriction system protein